jgi:excisionase family DNA binding protein
LNASCTKLDPTASPDLCISYLTAAEAAELLRCKPWHVIALIRNGLLIAARPVGPLGPWLIRRHDLDRCVARATTPAVNLAAS